jgi:hypothetical protein
VGGAGCAVLGICAYGGTSCNCAQAAGGPGGGGAMWACGTCPGTQPTGTCTTDGLDCAYGTTTCGCRRAGATGGDTWTCVTPPPPCPGTQPTPGGTCTAETGGTAGCTYGTTTCRCLGAAGGTGDEWSCN